jgi:hypothetical protein
MRYITFVLFSTSALTLGLVSGCGGDETTDIPANDASTDNTTGNDSSVGNDASNPPGDGSVITDGSVPSDGSNPGSDGGPTPGTIQCGSNTCQTATQECCIRFSLDGGADGGAGVSRTCIQKNGQCPNGATSACDDKADCPQNQVCCLEFGGNTLTGTCANNCGGQGVQLCKVTSECLNDGGACNTYTCPGNNVVQSCRKPFQQCQ